MYCCPFSLEKIQKDTCSLCPSGYADNWTLWSLSWQYLSNNNEIDPCSGSQIPALSEFTLRPTKAFGEAILLLFKEGYPVLS